MRFSYDLVHPRRRPVIRVNGIETLIDPGAEISLSVFSKDYFAKHYNIVGERRKEDTKTANSLMPGTILVLEKFELGELTIVGMPILIPDGTTYIKTPIALGADLFYNCGLDYGVLNSLQKFYIDISDEEIVRKYSLS